MRVLLFSQSVSQGKTCLRAPCAATALDDHYQVKIWKVNRNSGAGWEGLGEILKTLFELAVKSAAGERFRLA